MTTDTHLTEDDLIKIEKVEKLDMPDDAKNIVDRMKSKNKQVRRTAFKEARRLLKGVL